MAKSHFLDLVRGYEQPLGEDGNPLPLGKRFFAREISGSSVGNSKKKATSRIAEIFALIPRLLTYTKAKVYGLMAAAFGFSVLAIHLIGYYIGVFDSISTATLIIGAVFTVLGITLLFVEKPMPIMLQDTSVFDYVFFEFFCIQRVYRRSGEASIHPLVALTGGVLLALLSAFVPAEWIALGFGVVLFVTIAFGSPEFSYVTSILFLPYVGALPNGYGIFCFIIVLTAISFLHKAHQGKRIIYFEKYDFIILIMMLCIMISGIFIKGMESFLASASFAVMSLGYLVTSNIITNRRLADRAMNAVVVSSIPVSAVAIISYIAGSLKAGVPLFPSERSVFISTDIFATFLIVSICFAIAHIKQTRAVYKKLAYIGAFVMNFVALVFTGEVFALGSLLLGVIAYIAFKLKKPLPAVIIPILFVLPIGFYLMPENVISPLFYFVPSSAGYGETVKILTTSLLELGKNLAFGIGIGSESFSAEMLGQGIIAKNSGNLFIELALEAGVLSLVAFIFLIITRIGHRMSYAPYIKASVLKNSQPIVALALMSLLFYGMFTYIWADVSMFYLFFAVFGIESAMFRVSRRDNDERILYFVEARSVDSAAIDVGLDGE